MSGGERTGLTTSSTPRGELTRSRVRRETSKSSKEALATTTERRPVQSRRMTRQTNGWSGEKREPCMSQAPTTVQVIASHRQKGAQRRAGRRTSGAAPKQGAGPGPEGRTPRRPSPSGAPAAFRCGGLRSGRAVQRRPCVVPFGVPSCCACSCPPHPRTSARVPALHAQMRIN